VRVLELVAAGVPLGQTLDALARPERKVLFMSGHAFSHMAALAAPDSATLLQKPFTIGELAHAIQNLMDPEWRTRPCAPQRTAS
jgi:hypothetical protein